MRDEDDCNIMLLVCSWFLSLSLSARERERERELTGLGEAWNGERIGLVTRVIESW